MIKIHVLEIMSQITFVVIVRNDFQTKIAPSTFLQKKFESAVHYLIYIGSIFARKQTLVKIIS